MGWQHFNCYKIWKVPVISRKQTIKQPVFISRGLKSCLAHILQTGYMARGIQISMWKQASSIQSVWLGMSKAWAPKWWRWGGEGRKDSSWSHCSCGTSYTEALNVQRSNPPLVLAGSRRGDKCAVASVKEVQEFIETRAFQHVAST